jgi:HJR/Mrr/RecB family endonuclease
VPQTFADRCLAHLPYRINVKEERDGAFTVMVVLVVPPEARSTGSMKWHRKDPFAKVVSQLSVRILNLVRLELITTMRLVISADDHDRVTGMPVIRTILSVVGSKATVPSMDLQYADCIACLNNLGAVIAVPFDNGTLGNANHETATTTMLGDMNALTPQEFETFIGDLLQRLGLHVEVTRGSWDGGIDCIATDARPVVGGRIIVQAKRYAGTVNASVVRDLYGTVLSEGATKGVLITTGTFGPSTYDFIQGKPLEVIDGAALRTLHSKL